MITAVHQGLQDESYAVSISQFCRWFGNPRRTVHYKPTKKPPTVQRRFAQPIKQMIEEHPSFGYRTAAYLLKFNKNRVQRIFYVNALLQPRATGMASAPQWPVTDCGSRASTNRALRALGRAPTPLLLRSGSGLVFTSRSYTALVRSYGLTQEFITPHAPEQNGMVNV